jgi:hypothetical protein
MSAIGYVYYRQPVDLDDFDRMYELAEDADWIPIKGSFPIFLSDQGDLMLLDALDDPHSVKLWKRDPLGNGVLESCTQKKLVAWRSQKPEPDSRAEKFDRTSMGFWQTAHATHRPGFAFAPVAKSCASRRLLSVRKGLYS